MKLLIASACLACLLTGCGGFSTQSLFTTWTNADGSELDLSASALGSTQAYYEYFFGSRCRVTLTISGSESAGTMEVQSSEYLGTYYTQFGSRCLDLVDTFTFTKTDSTLTFCNADGCIEYE